MTRVQEQCLKIKVIQRPSGSKRSVQSQMMTVMNGFLKCQFKVSN